MLGRIGNLYDNPGPDEGWSWVILTGAFTISALTFGIGFSGGAGVLFREIVEVFHASRAEATWPFATIGITQCLMGLSVGFLNNVISTRAILFASSFMCSASLIFCYWATSTLYITIVFGLLFGAGQGLANTLAGVLICKYFVKYRSSANGIYSAGLPISGIAMPFLMDYLLRKYDLRSTMLLQGGIVLHMMIATTLMRTRKPRNFPVLNVREKLLEGTMNHENEQPAAVPTKSATNIVKEYLEVVRNPMFIIITLQAIIGIQGMGGIYQSLPDYLMDMDIAMNQAVIAISFFSACDLVSRVVSGFISDGGFFPRYYLAVVSMLMIGVGLTALGLFSNFYMLLIAGAIVAISMGTANNLINIFYCDYLGLDKIYTAISLRVFFVGLCGILRPIFLGTSRDIMGSYKYYYFFLAGTSLLSSVSWMFEPYLKWWTPPSTTKQQQELIRKKVTLYRLSSRLLPKETYREAVPQNVTT